MGKETLWEEAEGELEDKGESEEEGDVEDDILEEVGEGIGGVETRRRAERDGKWGWLVEMAYEELEG
jgi:hypothetical protein